MKTFEERYTAWIDGRLEGGALTSFEQELERRAAAGEAQADRRDTQRLRLLLRDHLEAPTLNNPEFFSHQLRERINAERTSTARRPQAAGVRGGLLSLFPWSVARLAGLGAACLFVAGALYYGLEPGPNAPAVAVRTPAPRMVTPEVQPAPTAVADVTPAPSHDPSDETKLALRSPTPAPFDDSPDIQIKGPSPASANAMLYKQNINVIWPNNLDYLPEVPGTAATPAASPAPSAAP